MHEIQGELPGTLLVPLSARLVEITSQFGVQQLQELNGKRARVIVHLVMALGAVVAPTPSDVEGVQVIHVCFNARKGVGCAVPSESKIGEDSKP